MNINEIRLSVKSLIEFASRGGDLSQSFTAGSRSIQGIKAHQKVQKLYKAVLPDDVEIITEQQVDFTLEYEGFNITIEGRIDGIFKDKDQRVTIDEIKSTNCLLKDIPGDGYELHWAQALCYAYIYSELNDLESVNVQLTYFQLESEETKSFIREYIICELKEYFYDLLDKYLVWCKLSREWNLKRNASIKECSFPYIDYRQGQRKFVVAVYKTIKENKRMFVQAPTGTGKTVSVLFPAIKALGENSLEKIFYLTARTTQRHIAEETIIKMIEGGLALKSLTITAKEKVCFKEKAVCDPDYCEYAKGYYDKIDSALLDIIEKESVITSEVIKAYAERYKVCPFELSLDASLWTDCIICDYNYVFDPKVYLKRYFSYGTGEYVFLVDESHNLVDRAREMFSTELSKKEVLDVKKALAQNYKKTELTKALKNINAFLLEEGRSLKNSYVVQEAEPKAVYPLLRVYLEEAEKWFVNNQGSNEYEVVLDLYFKLDMFLRIAEFYDDKYVTYVLKELRDVKIKLFCVDPSKRLNEVLKRGKSAVFFSATLSPIEYYMEVLGGEKTDYLMRLDSPFDRSRLGLFIAGDISTRYKNRELTYDAVAESIFTAVSSKTGNYIAFFPSYKYMNDVYQRFTEKYLNIDTIVQKPAMDEEERQKFLDYFDENTSEPHVAFAVLGGVFSEGIDLVGDKLLGVVIIGVGLPQLCPERDIIMEFFNKTKACGYEYAYVYPGINKVMQAGGRVIRSESDKGIIVLVDERYLTVNYQRLFPREWQHNIPLNNYYELDFHIKGFWENKNE